MRRKLKSLSRKEFGTKIKWALFHPRSLSMKKLELVQGQTLGKHREKIQILTSDGFHKTLKCCFSFSSCHTWAVEVSLSHPVNLLSTKPP